jgi:phage-related minor tail protein
LQAGTVVSDLPGYSSGLSQITSITRTVVGGVPGSINVILGATTAAIGPITTTVSLFSTVNTDTSTFVINYLTKVA